MRVKISVVALLFVLMPGIQFSESANVELVGLWPLDGDITDCSGNNNDGYLDGGSWVKGQIGSSALYLNGLSDGATIPDAPELRIGSEFSISLWLKVPNQTTPRGGYLFSRHGGESSQQAVIYGNKTDIVEFYQNKINGADPRPDSQMIIKDDAWHHIVYSYDGLTWEGYLDGKQIFKTQRLFLLNTDPYPWYIGSANGKNAFVNGAIDEISLFSHSLTDNEVALLYLKGDLIKRCNELSQNGMNKEVVTFLESVINNHANDEEDPHNTRQIKKILLSNTYFHLAQAHKDLNAEGDKVIEACKSAIETNMLSAFCTGQVLADLYEILTTEQYETLFASFLNKSINCLKGIAEQARVLNSNGRFNDAIKFIEVSLGGYDKWRSKNPNVIVTDKKHLQKISRLLLLV